MSQDGWSPADYARFRDARRRPFFDLLSLVEREALWAPRVLDAGCGTGELTYEAHRLLGASDTVGVDSSPAMLASAPGEARGGVRLVCASIPDGLPEGPFDVVLSNSALNWVEDHPRVLAALAARLAPGGQLAIQMPFNPDTPFTCACQVVAESAAFRDELSGYVYRSPVRPAELYARVLDGLGFERIRAGEWLYPQRHADVGGLVAFARGGLLSAYRSRLSPDRFEDFATAYEVALRAELGSGPVFFPFRRVLAWGERPR